VARKLKLIVASGEASLPLNLAAFVAGGNAVRVKMLSVPFKHRATKSQMACLCDIARRVNVSTENRGTSCIDANKLRLDLLHRLQESYTIRRSFASLKHSLLQLKQLAVLDDRSILALAQNIPGVHGQKRACVESCRRAVREEITNAARPAALMNNAMFSSHHTQYTPPNHNIIKIEGEVTYNSFSDVPVVMIERSKLSEKRRTSDRSFDVRGIVRNSRTFIEVVFPTYSKTVDGGKYLEDIYKTYLNVFKRYCRCVIPPSSTSVSEFLLSDIVQNNNMQFTITGVNTMGPANPNEWEYTATSDGNESHTFRGTQASEYKIVNQSVPNPMPAKPMFVLFPKIPTLIIKKNTIDSWARDILGKINDAIFKVKIDCPKFSSANVTLAIFDQRTYNVFRPVASSENRSRSPIIDATLGDGRQARAKPKKTRHLNLTNNEPRSTQVAKLDIFTKLCIFTNQQGTAQASALLWFAFDLASVSQFNVDHLPDTMKSLPGQFARLQGNPSDVQFSLHPGEILEMYSPEFLVSSAPWLVPGNHRWMCMVQDLFTIERIITHNELKPTEMPLLLVNRNTSFEALYCMLLALNLPKHKHAIVERCLADPGVRTREKVQIIATQKIALVWLDTISVPDDVLAHWTVEQYRSVASTQWKRKKVDSDSRFTIEVKPNVRIMVNSRNSVPSTRARVGISIVSKESFPVPWQLSQLKTTDLSVAALTGRLLTICNDMAGTWAGNIVTEVSRTYSTKMMQSKRTIGQMSPSDKIKPYIRFFKMVLEAFLSHPTSLLMRTNCDPMEEFEPYIVNLRQDTFPDVMDMFVKSLRATATRAQNEPATYDSVMGSAVSFGREVFQSELMALFTDKRDTFYRKDVNYLKDCVNSPNLIEGVTKTTNYHETTTHVDKVEPGDQNIIFGKSEFGDGVTVKFKPVGNKIMLHQLDVHFIGVYSVTTFTFDATFAKDTLYKHTVDWGTPSGAGIAKIAALVTRRTCDQQILRNSTAIFSMVNGGLNMLADKAPTVLTEAEAAAITSAENRTWMESAKSTFAGLSSIREFLTSLLNHAGSLGEYAVQLIRALLNAVQTFHEIDEGEFEYWLGEYVAGLFNPEPIKVEDKRTLETTNSERTPHIEATLKEVAEAKRLLLNDRRVKFNKSEQFGEVATYEFDLLFVRQAMEYISDGSEASLKLAASLKGAIGDGLSAVQSLSGIGSAGMLAIAAILPALGGVVWSISDLSAIKYILRKMYAIAHPSLRLNPGAMFLSDNAKLGFLSRREQKEWPVPVYKANNRFIKADCVNGMALVYNTEGKHWAVPKKALVFLSTADGDRILAETDGEGQIQMWQPNPNWPDYTQFYVHSVNVFRSDSAFFVNGDLVAEVDDEGEINVETAGMLSYQHIGGEAGEVENRYTITYKTDKADHSCNEIVHYNDPEKFPLGTLHGSDGNWIVELSCCKFALVRTSILVTFRSKLHDKADDVTCECDLVVGSLNFKVRNPEVCAVEPSMLQMLYDIRKIEVGTREDNPLVKSIDDDRYMNLLSSKKGNWEEIPPDIVTFATLLEQCGLKVVRDGNGVVKYAPIQPADEEQESELNSNDQLLSAVGYFPDGKPADGPAMYWDKLKPVAFIGRSIVYADCNRKDNITCKRAYVEFTKAMTMHVVVKPMEWGTARFFQDQSYAGKTRRYAATAAVVGGLSLAYKMYSGADPTETTKPSRADALTALTGASFLYDHLNEKVLGRFDNDIERAKKRLARIEESRKQRLDKAEIVYREEVLKLTEDKLNQSDSESDVSGKYDALVEKHDKLMAALHSKSDVVAHYNQKINKAAADLKPKIRSDDNPDTKSKEINEKYKNLRDDALKMYRTEKEWDDRLREIKKPLDDKWKILYPLGPKGSQQYMNDQKAFENEIEDATKDFEEEKTKRVAAFHNMQDDWGQHTVDEDDTSFIKEHHKAFDSMFGLFPELSKSKLLQDMMTEKEGQAEGGIVFTDGKVACKLEVPDGHDAQGNDLPWTSKSIASNESVVEQANDLQRDFDDLEKLHKKIIESTKDAEDLAHIQLLDPSNLASLVSVSNLHSPAFTFEGENAPFVYNYNDERGSVVVCENPSEASDVRAKLMDELDAQENQINVPYRSDYQMFDKVWYDEDITKFYLVSSLNPLKITQVFDEKQSTLNISLQEGFNSIFEDHGADDWTIIKSDGSTWTTWKETIKDDAKRNKLEKLRVTYLGMKTWVTHITIQAWSDIEHRYYDGETIRKKNETTGKWESYTWNRAGENGVSKFLSPHRLTALQPGMCKVRVDAPAQPAKPSQAGVSADSLTAVMQRVRNQLPAGPHASEIELVPIAYTTKHKEPKFLNHPTSGISTGSEFETLISTHYFADSENRAHELTAWGHQNGLWKWWKTHIAVFVNPKTTLDQETRFLLSRYGLLELESDVTRTRPGGARSNNDSLKDPIVYSKEGYLIYDEAFRDLNNKSFDRIAFRKLSKPKVMYVGLILEHEGQFCVEHEKDARYTYKTCLMGHDLNRPSEVVDKADVNSFAELYKLFLQMQNDLKKENAGGIPPEHERVSQFFSELRTSYFVNQFKNTVIKVRPGYRSDFIEHIKTYNLDESIDKNMPMDLNHHNLENILCQQPTEIFNMNVTYVVLTYLKPEISPLEPGVSKSVESNGVVVYTDALGSRSENRPFVSHVLGTDATLTTLKKEASLPKGTFLATTHDQRYTEMIIQNNILKTGGGKGGVSDAWQLDRSFARWNACEDRVAPQLVSIYEQWEPGASFPAYGDAYTIPLSVHNQLGITCDYFKDGYPEPDSSGNWITLSKATVNKYDPLRYPAYKADAILGKGPSETPHACFANKWYNRSRYDYRLNPNKHKRIELTIEYRELNRDFITGTLAESVKCWNEKTYVHNPPAVLFRVSESDYQFTIIDFTFGVLKSAAGEEIGLTMSISEIAQDIMHEELAKWHNNPDIKKKRLQDAFAKECLSNFLMCTRKSERFHGSNLLGNSNQPSQNRFLEKEMLTRLHDMLWGFRVAGGKETIITYKTRKDPVQSTLPAFQALTCVLELACMELNPFHLDGHPDGWTKIKSYHNTYPDHKTLASTTWVVGNKIQDGATVVPLWVDACLVDHGSRQTTISFKFHGHGEETKVAYEFNSDKWFDKHAKRMKTEKGDFHKILTSLTDPTQIILNTVQNVSEYLDVLKASRAVTDAMKRDHGDPILLQGVSDDIIRVNEFSTKYSIGDGWSDNKLKRLEETRIEERDRNNLAELKHYLKPFVESVTIDSATSQMQVAEMSINTIGLTYDERASVQYGTTNAAFPIEKRYAERMNAINARSITPASQKHGIETVSSNDVMIIATLLGTPGGRDYYNKMFLTHGSANVDKTIIAHAFMEIKHQQTLEKWKKIDWAKFATEGVDLWPASAARNKFLQTLERINTVFWAVGNEDKSRYFEFDSKGVSTKLTSDERNAINNWYTLARNFSDSRKNIKDSLLEFAQYAAKQEVQNYFSPTANVAMFALGDYVFGSPTQKPLTYYSKQKSYSVATATIDSLSDYFQMATDTYSFDNPAETYAAFNATVKLSKFDSNTWSDLYGNVIDACQSLGGQIAGAMSETARAILTDKFMRYALVFFGMHEALSPLYLADRWRKQLSDMIKKFDSSNWTHGDDAASNLVQDTRKEQPNMHLGAFTKIVTESHEQMCTGFARAEITNMMTERDHKHSYNAGVALKRLTYLRTAATVATFAMPAMYTAYKSWFNDFPEKEMFRSMAIHCWLEHKSSDFFDSRLGFIPRGMVWAGEVATLASKYFVNEVLLGVAVVGTFGTRQVLSSLIDIGERAGQATSPSKDGQAAQNYNKIVAETPGAQLVLSSVFGVNDVTDYAYAVATLAHAASAVHRVVHGFGENKPFYKVLNPNFHTVAFIFYNILRVVDSDKDKNYDLATVLWQTDDKNAYQAKLRSQFMNDIAKFNFGTNDISTFAHDKRMGFAFAHFDITVGTTVFSGDAVFKEFPVPLPEDCEKYMTDNAIVLSANNAETDNRVKLAASANAQKTRYLTTPVRTNFNTRGEFVIANIPYAELAKFLKTDEEPLDRTNGFDPLDVPTPVWHVPSDVMDDFWNEWGAGLASNKRETAFFYSYDTLRLPSFGTEGITLVTHENEPADIKMIRNRLSMLNDLLTFTEAERIEFPHSAANTKTNKLHSAHGLLRPLLTSQLLEGFQYTEFSSKYEEQVSAFNKDVKLFNEVDVADVLGGTLSSDDETFKKDNKEYRIIAVAGKICTMNPYTYMHPITDPKYRKRNVLAVLHATFTTTVEAITRDRMNDFLLAAATMWYEVNPETLRTEGCMGFRQVFNQKIERRLTHCVILTNVEPPLTQTQLSLILGGSGAAKRWAEYKNDAHQIWNLVGINDSAESTFGPMENAGVRYPQEWTFVKQDTTIPPWLAFAKLQILQNRMTAHNYMLREKAALLQNLTTVLEKRLAGPPRQIATEAVCVFKVKSNVV